MTNSGDEPTDRDGGLDAPAGGSRGPAQWVPKGALSRFLVQGAASAFAAQILAIIAGVVVILLFVGGLGRWLALQVFDSRLMSNTVRSS